MVIGEETGIGACSGNLTIAWPRPLPTIAPGHSLRACGTVVLCSLAAVHTGRPAVSTDPWRSNSNWIVFRTGGSVPSAVPILPWPKIVIGAATFLGSAVGVEPPAPGTTMFPTRIRIARGRPAAARTGPAANAPAAPPE